MRRSPTPLRAGPSRTSSSARWRAGSSLPAIPTTTSRSRTTSSVCCSPAAIPRSRSKSSEVRGLLALLLLTDARRAARVDGAGDVVLLEEQDRTRWNGAQIREELNRAIAVAMADGIERGLPLLDARGELVDHHLLWTARAVLERRLHEVRAADGAAS